MTHSAKPTKSSQAALPSAAESREQLRYSLARRYGFGVAFLMSVLGYTAYQLTPGEALGVPAEVRQHAAVAFGTAVVAVTALLGLVAFRRRFAEMERIRNLRAQLTIYRVGETLERLDREDELVRCALDVIADGTGLAYWAIYRRDDRDGAFRLTATRGLPEGAKKELAPDPIGPNALSPATRAAWLVDTIVTRDAGASPHYDFPAATDGLDADPIIVSVPLTDRGEAVGVLQCFVPRRKGFEGDQLALVRWTASQLAVGLKRLKMERRDRMLATYLRGSSEIVLLLDADGRVADANETAERALGAAPGMLRRHLASEFATEEASGRPFSPGGHVADGKSVQLALRLRASDGRQFPCDAMVTAIANPETGESACLVIARDVTERREREEALRVNAQAQRHLNDQLRQANARLEEARQTQQQFLANTSHELRTPLNSVIGFATLLEQGSAESPEEVRSFANSVRLSAEHLLGLLNDILDLAKMEAGRLDLTLERGDARHAVRAAVAAVAPEADGKGLEVRVELPESELAFSHDSARFRQVMLNLVGNAVKFTDRGEVSVRAWRDDDRAEVCVVVADTGIGIPLDRQSNLFTKYASREASYAKRRPGTGLGLAISKGLVERMGGSISVESEGANRGTRVRIIFPLETAPDAAAADVATESQA
ncbi:MAG TPA: ATP-binding protein [Candidatus Eisenbacteria bacterium]|nr:ATP-binding protein [Candidatus Eisenbacteria bacterium]